MAKIIQFKGWYQTEKEKDSNIVLNADYITTIDVLTEKNISVTRINIFSSCSDSHAPSIYTKLSVSEIIKLVND